MADGISIFDVIKRGGYEASLITTFNATLPFYEEVVLRKLVGAGCRHNVVLMDRRQCAAAWESEASRPRLAGYGYTLLPVGVSGAFHPKVCILAGPKKAAVLIGSHNLTLSGFGYNREITNWIEIGGAKDVDGASILRAVWKMVREWIELERGNVPEGLIESTMAMANFIDPLVANAGEQTSDAALAQTPGALSLFEQMAGRIPGSPSRIAVIGAFFDQDQAFIGRLKAQWPSSEIVIGIDPETVQLPGTPSDGVARYVDARPLWNDDGSYLHAKAIYFESSDTANDVFVCGSANPSRPAWMADASGGNVEAVLLRSGPDARNIAAATSIQLLFDLPKMAPEEFASIALRSKASAETETPKAVPILSGVADADLGLVRISHRNKPLNPTSAVLFGPNLEQLEFVTDVSVSEDSLVFRPSVEINSIRSCVLECNGESVARAMIVHPAILASNSRSSKQYQIRSALGALGATDGDISKVILAVEKVIFADETTREVEVAMREQRERRAKQTSEAGPASLAISVNDMGRAKKKIRLLKSGDLAYLIDVLLRRLSEGLETKTVETDRAGRTEEEQIGKDDDESPEPGDSANSLPATTLTDREIAELVARRARTLIRRMVSQLELASKENSRKASAVMQLVAVLALVRELRHLDKQKRWRATGLVLVEENDRRHLLDESVKYLFGGKTSLVDAVDHVGEESSEEATQLRVLLAWLAWDVGDELTEQLRRIYDATELKTKLRANALFLKLMPSIALDDSATAELRESISKTVKPSPAALARANKWITDHLGFGKSWSHVSVDASEPKVGGYCQLLGRPGKPHVVMEVQSKIVGFWDYDRIRQFTKDKVTSIRAIAQRTDSLDKDVLGAPHR